MRCDALLGHSKGVANIAKRARYSGASGAEIAETPAVAFLMGGLSGIVPGANTFQERTREIYNSPEQSPVLLTFRVVHFSEMVNSTSICYDFDK